MYFFFLPLIFIFSLYSLSNLFNKKLKLDEFEKPIFSLGLIILILNYLYFNFNIKLEIIFFLIVILTILSLLILLFRKKSFLHLKEISFIILLVTTLFTIVGIIYGEQFYVFRGNIHDHFVYLSTGLAFNSYNHAELINLKENFPSQLENEFYLKHILNLIYYRPSIQLFLGLLLNFKFINVIEVSYIFKIINTILVSLASTRFFFKLTKNLNSSIFLSLGFVFSFYYFYNFEIDAFSLIFSLSFMFLIFSYLLELPENLDKKNFIFYFKIGIIGATAFIIYPNGFSVIMVPIFFYVVYLIKYSKYFKQYILNLLFAGTLFCLIIYPTYESTIIYLIEKEIPVGLKHKVDFWGYYGAFIFGKDNPIHNAAIVTEVKQLWLDNSSLIKVIPKIIKINLENNPFFIINIIPSIFGFYHFTLSENYGFLNLFLFIILFFLNLVIIKRLFKNFQSILKIQNKFNIFLKIFLFYFVLFFIFLIITNQLWSAIKLYFIISPIMFILISLDFKKKTSKFNKKYLLIMLVILPIYKYSEFNHGIGKLDSFPSIIKKNSKFNFKWSIDRKKLKKCKNIDFDLNDKFHKIYVSLIFKNMNLDYDGVDCKIKLSNGKFEIRKI